MEYQPILRIGDSWMIVPTLKIGDSVDWRGGWGRDAPKRVIVLGIDYVEAGEKYGIEVEAIAWSDVADHSVVTLDNNHWAYGYQITRVKH